MRYRDRRDAGRRLAAFVAARVPHARDLLVLGLPRGGVPVAYEVATALGAPLDVLCVRKLGVPGHAEFAMGAIAPGGVRFVNGSLVARLGLRDDEVEHVVRLERRELERRERLYRAGRPPLDLLGRRVLLVDDGLATGATLSAACLAARALGASEVIAAAPVASPTARADLEDVADAVLCPLVPDGFAAVGAWYEDFGQTDDTEVQALLTARGTSSPRAARPA